MTLIRTLIVDDSATARALLRRALEAGDLHVVGEARSGEEAVDSVRRLRPDVVVMDVHMPHMNGYEATDAIMRERPTPIVMVSASLSAREVATGMEAMRAGALAALVKPGNGDEPTSAAARRLVRTVHSMSAVKLVGRRVSPTRRARLPRVAEGTVDLVCLAASTGGPAVLHELLGRLPADLAAPILFVQHLTTGYESGMAAWLDEAVPLRVAVARDGELARPGSAYMAPSGRHLTVAPDLCLQLTDDGPDSRFRPSGDALFASAARSLGKRCLAAVLTGMGSDGCLGLEEVRRAGGITVAQSEDTCTVYGMPRAAIESGAAGVQLAPSELAALIMRSVKRKETPWPAS